MGLLGEMILECPYEARLSDPGSPLINTTAAFTGLRLLPTAQQQLHFPGRPTAGGYAASRAKKRFATSLGRSTCQTCIGPARPLISRGPSARHSNRSPIRRWVVANEDGAGFQRPEPPGQGPAHRQHVHSAPGPRQSCPRRQGRWRCHPRVQHDPGAELEAADCALISASPAQPPAPNHSGAPPDSRNRPGPRRHMLRDKAAKSLHFRRHLAVVGSIDLPQIFRVESRRKRSRADKVAEHVLIAGARPRQGAVPDECSYRRQAIAVQARAGIRENPNRQHYCGRIRDSARAALHRTCCRTGFPPKPRPCSSGIALRHRNRIQATSHASPGRRSGQVGARAKVSLSA